MITLSNGLSFFRAPLALIFLLESPTLRFVAVLLAMISDSVDGYFARKYRSASRFGAILDPAMDKFFVYFALCTFLFESKIAIWQLLAMLARDGFLLIYSLIALTMRRWDALTLRPIRWGKVTTALQFITLMGLSFELQFPWPFYICFVAMGAFAFLELLQFSDLKKVKVEF